MDAGLRAAIDVLYQFILVSDSYQSIDVQANAHPEFVDLDGDSDLDMLVGSGNIGVLVLENVGTVDNASFIISPNFSIEVMGKNTAPVSGYLFNEYNLDILVGMSTGGIYHLSGRTCISGDVNNDNTIDVSDILIIINSILYNDPSGESIFCSADINQDISIDIFDIVLLVGIILV